MEKNQYSLCTEVLRRLDMEGVLDRIVLIGSWCVLFYENFFDLGTYSPTIRTRDIDILIPLTAKFDHKVNISDLVMDLGFVVDFRRPDGYIRLMHPELILEFIVPERGRSKGGVYDLPDLGINAQPLRFMELLLENTIRLQFKDLYITVPHPSNFAIHKLIISARRREEKKDRDQRQALYVLNALIESGLGNVLKQTYSGIPKKWRNVVQNTLDELGEENIMDLLKLE